jgi:hypothetical protein
MLLRLMPHRGGDGTVCGIISMNDTGSDILSLFLSDLQLLRTYKGTVAGLGLLGSSVQMVQQTFAQRLRWKFGW